MNLEVIKVTQTRHICRLPPVTRIDRHLQILRESSVGFLLNANSDNVLAKSVGMIKHTCESGPTLFCKVENTCCDPPPQRSTTTNSNNNNGNYILLLMGNLPLAIFDNASPFLI